MRADLLHGSLKTARTRGIPGEPKNQCWRFHDVREANYAIVRAFIVRNVGCGTACGWRVNNGRIDDRRIGNSRPSFAIHAADGQRGSSAHWRHSTAADRQHHRAADRLGCAFESAGIESDQSERKHNRAFNNESEQP